MFFLKLNISFLVGFLLLFSAQTCSVPEGESSGAVTVMRINHFKQTGFGVGPTLVMLVQQGDAIGTENWNYFYDEIKGFDYEPGFIYELKVRKKKIKNPPADASSVEYILVKVISQDAVDPAEEFDIRLKWDGTSFLGSDGNNAFSLLNEYNINCQNLCGELASSVQGPNDVTGTFVHDTDGSLKLIALH